MPAMDQDQFERELATDLTPRGTIKRVFGEIYRQEFSEAREACIAIHSTPYAAVEAEVRRDLARRRRMEITVDKIARQRRIVLGIEQYLRTAEERGRSALRGAEEQPTP